MGALFQWSKVLALFIFVLSLTGCASSRPPEHDFQGKVWRGLVNTQLVDTSSPTREARNEEWVAATKYNPKTDVGLRINRVVVGRGFNFVVANANVPDQIEFADLPKGTLVDLMAVKGTELDHSTWNFTRVLRIVCKKGDDECFEREKKADRIRAVIDANPPADLNQKLGLTFNRRVTKEEVKKYD